MSSRQTLPAETEASLRESLRGQIEVARAALSANLAQLRNMPGADSALVANGEAQLGALAALQSQIEHANPMALAMIGAMVAASANTANALAQQVQAASTVAQAAAAAEQLAAASKAARETVGAFEEDFYKRKIFDPYLRFASKEDEDAYRKREAEWQRQIKAAEAKQTPEGELEALRLTRAQLIDAGAHGADRSPDYQPRMERLDQATTNLQQQIETPASKKSSPPNDPIAALRAAGVSLADQTQDGHGVAVADSSISTVRSRT